MDPENPVVRLCVRGMEAEAAGQADAAHDLFRQAWDTATDDYEACVAAHYLARRQSTAEERLRWNEECLMRAERVGDNRVRSFYPSLYVNLGQVHEELGSPAVAYAHFARAVDHFDAFPPGPYGDWTRLAVADGLRRTAPGPSAGNEADEETPHERRTVVALRAVDALLGPLVEQWCARSDLRALGVVLPAYLAYLGSPEDRLRLRTALHMVHAGGRLPEDEQRRIGAAIGSPVLA
ncbi:hypothetical protein [Streptomyces sp. NPDC003077]|uniref:hypothetical protein n=1 Tax=Streptomyces sp. NPDC003077 TaxID=3154443 RepID=UPI0033B6F222